jgi:uracil phosphoribosyltransferase
MTPNDSNRQSPIFLVEPMIITAATPQDLVDWFHTRQEHQRVLCVLLAPSQEDQR